MNNNDIILSQAIFDGSSYKFKEVVPFRGTQGFVSDEVLTMRQGSELLWAPIDLSLNIIVNNHFKDTDIYYDNGRIGIGRFPSYTYIVDLAVPKNNMVTAFHIGDGSFGFSMGNGTTQGFIPEIIGIGSDENDTGLYFVGVAGNDVSSNIPLIVLDGRSTYNTKLSNRPILGITSADYNDYSVLVDASNNLNVKGNISVTDLIISNLSLLDIIENLQEQIDYLQTKIT